MPTVYGYCRGSTNEQEGTLEVQEGAIRHEFDYAFARDGFAWGGCFVDRGVSGSKRLQARPEGLKMLLTLQPLDVVVMTKLDRGFRNARDFLEQLDSFEARRIRLVLLDMRLDTGTPLGRFVAGILAQVAEFERNLISQRTKDVNRHRRALGLPTGRGIWGYKHAGPRKNRRYVKDTAQREMAGRVLDWFEQGWTLDRIWLHLLAEKVTRANGTYYGRGTLGLMLLYEPIMRQMEAAGVTRVIRVKDIYQEQRRLRELEKERKRNERDNNGRETQENQSP